MMGAPTRHRGRSRYPTRSRNAGATGAAPATFNPLTGWTTDPIHGVWASDPLWTPPADGGAVSSWRNGGTVGGDLVQATGSKQPTYRASTAAFNNKPTVQGDGVDDYLDVAFASVAQPTWHVLIGNIHQVSAPEPAVFDSMDATNRQTVFLSAPSKWSQFAGATRSEGTGTADTSPHLFVARFEAASSTLAVDGTTRISGATVGTGATDSIRLFANVTPGFYNGGHIAYWALFNTDPTAQAEWATFKAWVTSTYGITVA